MQEDPMGPLDCKYISSGKFQLYTMTAVVKIYEIGYESENIFTILRNIFSVLRNIFSILQKNFSMLRNIFIFYETFFEFYETVLVFCETF